MESRFHLGPLPDDVRRKKVVMYSPWPDGSFLDDAEQYVTAAQKRGLEGAKGKAHKPTNIGMKVYHLRSKGQGLSDLLPGDRLYIMGHGIQFEDPAMIKGDYAWTGPEQEGYSTHYVGKEIKIGYPALTPKQLLEKLLNEGLSLWLVTDIRLWVCRSGEKGDTTFAWEFTDLITEINKKVIVTAYRGFMLFRKYSGEKRGNETRDPYEESKRARDFKVVINPPPVKPLPVTHTQVTFQPLCIDTDIDLELNNKFEVDTSSW